MPVLQEYYTSAEGKGFHVKATSPGITADLQSAIDRLISYRMPSSLDSRAIDTHPVALRYWYNALKPDRSILLCSQSAASDETNRAGNYFAHTLVMEPTNFSSIPPIFYWRSPVWQRNDPVQRTQVDSLPILDASKLEILDISFEDMWAFLALGEHRHWLYKLLSAVVLSPKTKRRIVIVDTIENVVWWIKLVTLLLPPDYRPLLSFSTYSHDLTLSPHLITGTTSDWFRDMEREYLTYFVLNAEQGRYSNVEDSFYAREVVNAATPEMFDGTLLRLLTDCTTRFSLPIAIDPQLEIRMSYAKIQQGKTDSKLSEAELQAIHMALDAFNNLSPFSSEDIAELKRLKIALEEATEHQSSQSLREDYQQVCTLLELHEPKEAQPARDTTPGGEKKHQFQKEELAHIQDLGAGEVGIGEQISVLMKNVALNASAWLPKLNGRGVVDEEAKQFIPNEQGKPQEEADPRIQEVLKNFILEFEPKERPEVNVQRIQQLSKQYGDTILSTQVNQAEFIKDLITFWEDLLKNSRYDYLIYFWEYLGRYLKPSLENWKPLHFSLSEIDRLMKRANEKDIVHTQEATDSEAKSETLFETIIVSMTEWKQGWLELVIVHKSSLSPAIARRFYVKCIETLSLDQRPPLRAIGHSIFKDMRELLGDELDSDLEQSKKKQKLAVGYAVLENWVRHLRQQDYDEGTVEEIKKLGLHMLKMKCNTQQWRELARPILMSSTLAPLPQEIEIEVARVVLPALSLARFESADVRFCKKYRTAEFFGEDTRTTLSTIVAMQNHVFMDEVLAQRIQRQVKILLPNEYEPGVQRFMTEFFQHDITTVAHGNMITAFFTRNFSYNVHFWKAYQDAWQKIFLEPATTARAAYLLDFWFDESSIQFSYHLYILQEFFFNLPDLITRSREMLKNEALHKTVSAFCNYDWYPLVQEYFSLKEQPVKETSSLADLVASLFNAGATKKNNWELLKNIAPLDHAAFWHYYWQRFNELILRGDATQVLAHLSFWFDGSFEVLGGTNWLSRKFFLKLEQRLDHASRKQSFHSIVHEINKKGRASGAPYQWYPLVEKYFAEPQK